MTDEPTTTCGQGLAQNAVLPQRLGEVVAGLAQNLEVHMRALDLSDEAAAQEHAAYAELAAGARRIAEQLHALAAEMAGHADLPMGRHDMKVMSSPAVLEAFERFVAAERAARATLEANVARDEAMLARMGEMIRGVGA